MFEAIHPATGRVVRRVPTMSGDEVEHRIRTAVRAFEAWRHSAWPQRAAALRALARVLRSRTAELAHLMAEEMGKPVVQGRAEVEKCAWVCEFYAEHGAAFLEPEPVTTEWRRSYVAFLPLGPILGVMPWNFPFWQVFRAAAPALAAGNVFLLKHASNVPGCALAIEELAGAADLPEGTLQVLMVGAAQVEGLVAHPAIRGVTLTGSTPAGRAVAARAGAMLKKTVLELGGSDPYVVLEDADLDLAAETCVNARLINTGQSCIAAKRFIVVEAVRAAFETRVVERMQARQPGDPFQEDTVLGPLARRDLRDELHRQVEQSLARGAALRCGGRVPEGPGAYYPCTVLTDVRPGMPAFDEETFGPVAAIVPARDEAEALRLANQSPFGLGAALFTRDVERGERLAREHLEAGVCMVNDFVRSDPRLPFGGIKDSGYGRELGLFGLREFVNIKTVCVR